MSKKNNSVVLNMSENTSVELWAKLVEQKKVLEAQIRELEQKILPSFKQEACRAIVGAGNIPAFRFQTPKASGDIVFRKRDGMTLNDGKSITEIIQENCCVKLSLARYLVKEKIVNVDCVNTLTPLNKLSKGLEQIVLSILKEQLTNDEYQEVVTTKHVARLQEDFLSSCAEIFQGMRKEEVLTCVEGLLDMEFVVYPAHVSFTEEKVASEPAVTTTIVNEPTGEVVIRTFTKRTRTPSKTSKKVRVVKK